MQSTPSFWRKTIVTGALVASVFSMGIEGIGATNAAPAGVSARGLIKTVAGTGRNGYTGTGKPATGARISWPYSVSADIGGNVFVCEGDNQVIRRIDLIPGILRLIAGTHEEGFAGDGGPATSAQFSFPSCVVVDSRRHVWIADSGNMRVRRIDASTGFVRTVAGKAGRGFSGDGGPATQALLDVPNTIAVDANGNLFISDANNNRVRRVDARSGIIDTVLGTGEPGYNGDGADARETQIGLVNGLALDAAGNLYFSDASNNRVRRVDAQTKIVTTVAGTGEPGFAGDGGSALEARLRYPAGLALDVDGSILIADRFNNRIRRVDGETGIITTLAGTGVEGYTGDGGPATDAQLNEPSAISLDPAGVLYIADTGNFAVRAVPGVGAAGKGIQTPVIDGVTYEKPTLTIMGANLFAMPGVVVRINGRNVVPKVGLLDPTNLKITVGPKQSRLVPGDNEVVVTVGGIDSNTFVMQR
jgi:hypothetical protein